MTDPDFPQELRTFIQDAIPNVDAAEVLLLLARERERSFEMAAIEEAMKPSLVDAARVRRYVAGFHERRLIAHLADGSYRYEPATEALENVVRALAKAYNERPVTLVRLIYSLKDEKIRSFSDAFRFKRD